MSVEALKSVCAPGSMTSLPPLPPLCAPSLDPAAASNQLELEMRFLVSEHRKVKHDGTVFFVVCMEQLSCNNKSIERKLAACYLNNHHLINICYF